jgi:hypothetical protein
MSFLVAQILSASASNLLSVVVRYRPAVAYLSRRCRGRLVALRLGTGRLLTYRDGADNAIRPCFSPASEPLLGAGRARLRNLLLHGNDICTERNLLGHSVKHGEILEISALFANFNCLKRFNDPLIRLSSGTSVSWRWRCGAA